MRNEAIESVDESQPVPAGRAPSRRRSVNTADRSPSAPEGKASDAAVGTGPTVLVVNDIRDQSQLLGMLLARAGFRVRTAADGREGYRCARRARPHLIISDVAMPVADGVELCRLVRADDELRLTPILLVSAVRVDSASAVEGLRAGADDYLEVPFDPPRLLAKARRLLERGRTEDELERAVKEQSARLETLNRALGAEKVGRRRAERAAHFDALTGLPNRMHFEARLPQALALTERSRRMLAVLLLDLDRFTTINETLGTAVGDQLLREVAERVSACVRRSDIVARYAGDEFAVALLQLERADDAARVARRAEDAVAVAQNILRALDAPYLIDSHELFLTASIGVGVYPGDGREAQTLLKNAASALCRAKERGGRNYQFYTADMNERAVERLALENGLRRAIERDEFVLHYQPVVDLRAGEIVGAEALIRWQHPQLGLVPPLQFIPLAEEAGLMGPIGEWALRAACAQNKAWQDEGFKPVRVAANLSAKQFRQPDLARTVEQVLGDTGLDPAFLELELTESSIMSDADQSVETLRAIRRMGVRVAVDDFGTGYSSLAYLKRLPLDVLKIDRSFVSDVTADADDALIVKALIGLAHNLNLRVTAEGVETGGQLSFLREVGCDEAQGYLLARPQPAAIIRRMLRRSGASSSGTGVSAAQRQAKAARRPGGRTIGGARGGR